ncbi:probable membrane-associated kinase regulator 1 [Durio zibethinus]|uniref:Probable membrane-associated kinase regulator 1 n=1 Tax=Durio zibethinus TaxID=66656 RepID=A0A6P5X3B9_DURZI|nr:probable membrane-associated kinase regulator 1 [Durio zibethinus]
MGKRKEKIASRSQTLPPSPSHSFSSSSSSSDFEFTISLSPRANSSSTLRPADELFYKGQLLPLHLSPRLSMVRTLLLASSSTSSASETSSATASRDSTGSSNDSHSSFTSDLVLLVDCDSSRPSSATEDDEFKRLNNGNQLFSSHQGQLNYYQIKKSKYFSLSRFSSVFKKENNKNQDQENMAAASSSVKKISTTAKEVIRKYLKKVKPLYEKLSQKQQHKVGGIGVVSALSSTKSGPASFSIKPERSVKDIEKINARKESSNSGFSHSFSGNLRYRRRRSCVSSCPSSMRSSPSHSGVLSRNGFPTMGTNTGRVGSAGSGMHYSDTSSMEELQSAIQGAIAHCKNSLLQNKTTAVNNEV